jgi:hypothetical protein
LKSEQTALITKLLAEKKWIIENTLCVV